MFITSILLSAVILTVQSQSNVQQHSFIYYSSNFIECDVIDSNYFNTQWFKNDLPINVSSDSHLVLSSAGTLLFVNFLFSDEGRYYCNGSATSYELSISCGSNGEINTKLKSCLCVSGYYVNSSPNLFQCSPCPIGTYKPFTNSGSCFPCEGFRTTQYVATVSIEDCICQPGYGYSQDSNFCSPCPSNFYQPAYLNTTCIPCPIYSATPVPFGEAEAEAFTNLNDCMCLFSPGNASDSICYYFVSQPNVSVISVDSNSVTLYWDKIAYAMGSELQIQGLISGYIIKAAPISNIENIVFISYQFNINDNYTVLIHPIQSASQYQINVTAYVTVDVDQLILGPPSVINVITLAQPSATPSTTTITTPTTTTTPTPTTPSSSSSSSIPPTTTYITNISITDTTTPLPITTTTTIPTTDTNTVTTSPTAYTSPITSDMATASTLNITSTSTLPTTSDLTTSTANPTDVVSFQQDYTSTSILSALVLFLIVIITAIIIAIIVRALYNRKRKRDYAGVYGGVFATKTSSNLRFNLSNPSTFEI